MQNERLRWMANRLTLAIILPPSVGRPPVVTTIDSRRAGVGMPPLAEYLREARRFYRLAEGQEPKA